MSDSVWKKEISFRRKPKDEAQEPVETAAVDEAPKTSVWKKEISFGRKPKDEVQEPVEAAPVDEAPTTSVWKKEISFGRKPKEPTVETPTEEVAAPVTAPVLQEVAPLPEPAPTEVETPKTSVWKKEITLGRKPKEPEAPKEPTVEAPEEVAAPVDELREKELDFQRRLQQVARDTAGSAAAPAAEPESIWKKEISFRRKPKEEQPASAPAPADEPTGEDPVSIWKKEITLRRKRDADAPRERGDSIWTKEISFRRREARAAQVRKLAEEALKELEESSPEPWLDEAELPPDALDDFDLAPPPERAPAKAEAKQSIWKREIGGKKTPKASKAEGSEPAKPMRKRKPRTKLRDVKISLPRRQAKTHGGHAVKRLVGLKVGASQLAAARIINNGAAELAQVVREPLDQGVVVGGEVRDPEALAMALKQFFARNKLPRKNVRLGIASNRIGVRIFDLVGIDDEKQLENAIRFRAQETLPIPLDEAVLDYHVLGETTDADGAATQRVLLVVAYRELVDRYVLACKRAGITLAGVDLEAFALLRALAAPRTEDSQTDSALVAVSIGHDRSTFAVSDGRICEFTRVIEWGGATLNVAIARALDLAPSEVEQLKRLVSLESPAVPDGVSPVQYTHAVDAVRKQVQAFARELVSSLQFYQHQPGSLGIGEIVITGGTAGLAGIAAELQSLIGVRVRVGDPLARLKVPKKLDVDEDLGSYAIAIGLGIED